MTKPTAIDVRYVAEAKRFEASTGPDGPTAFLDVMPATTVWTLSHTEVPRELEGQGYGTALVQAALDHVRGVGATVMPLCPFVVAHLRRHPEQADLVHERFRSMLGRGPEAPS
jgi:uncharacterized protein